MIQSPLNYTGGKFKLLPQILPLFPGKIDQFVDLFCGGCNVGLNVTANKVIYNDLDENVINLYKTLLRLGHDMTFEYIHQIIDDYELSLASQKGYAYYGCDSSKGLSRYNKPHFLQLRSDFNARQKKDSYNYIINGFACAVARTALWIAEQQALDDTESTISGLPRLPFTDTAHIQQGNALRLDWNELLPGDHCDYVMGNPPFIGHVTKTAGQTDDLKTVWGRQYDGYLDYATGWYRKAASYLSKPDAAFAFVTTNSITQGQPVEPLLKPLHADGWHIRFAHRTFAWDAQSTDNAHVHVVIIGLDRKAKPAPVLFEYPDISGEPVQETALNINGYLIDAPDLYVGKRSQKTGPVSPLLDVTDSGSMPLDGGNLLLADREEYAKAMADPIAARFVRPFRMGRELINGTDRWCLWLRDAEPGELRKSSFLKKRVDACAEYRRNAPMKGDAYRHRATPWLFRDDHQPSMNYLAIPKVFSEDREYMTCDWYTPDIIAGDMVYTSPDRDGLAFAVIESRMFMTWQQTIGGRLESRCRFSNTVIWNNLPLPALDDDTRMALIEAGRNVLATRANHPGQSLADLYDPDYMPTDLRAAHRELDKVADVAFGADRRLGDDDDARLKILFDSYARMTAERG